MADAARAGYNAETAARFAAAGHSGSLSGNDVVHGAAGSVKSGTWVQFDVRLSAPDHDARRCITEARFRAFGCPHVIAAADWICERARGADAAVSTSWTAAALRSRLDAPIEKLGRFLVVEDAWIAAMRAARPASGLS